MHRIVPSPLGGYMLVNENGLVLDAGGNIESLRANMRLSLERRALSPFMHILNEFGEKVMIKDYVRY